MLIWNTSISTIEKYSLKGDTKWHHSFRVHTSNQHDVIFLLYIFPLWKGKGVRQLCILPVWLWHEGSSAVAELGVAVPAERHTDSAWACKLQLHPAKLQAGACVLNISPDMGNTTSKHYKLDVSPISSTITTGLFTVLYGWSPRK